MPVINMGHGFWFYAESGATNVIDMQDWQRTRCSSKYEGKRTYNAT